MVSPEVLEMMQLPLPSSKKGVDEDMMFPSAFFGRLTRHDPLVQRFWKSPLAEGGADLMDKLSVLFGSITCVIISHSFHPTAFRKCLAR